MDQKGSPVPPFKACNWLALQCKRLNVRITWTDLSVAFPTFVTFTLGWTVIQRLDTLGMGITRNAITVSLSWKERTILKKQLLSVSTVMIVTPCRKIRNRCMGRWLKDRFSYLSIKNDREVGWKRPRNQVSNVKNNVTDTAQNEGDPFVTFIPGPTSFATESITSKSCIAFTLKRAIRVDAVCVQVTRTSSKIALVFV